jgi:hypothetical protein
MKAATRNTTVTAVTVAESQLIVVPLLPLFRPEPDGVAFV